MKRRARSHRYSAVLVALIVGAVFVFLSISTASALTSQYCESDSDCAEAFTCLDNQCVAPDSPDFSPFTEGVSIDDISSFDASADEVCGADRRCRIARLAARRQLQRYFDAAVAHQQVRQEVQAIQEEQTPDVPREANPWLLSFHIHSSMGYGLLAGRSIATHFRLEATLLSHSELVRHHPSASHLPSVSDFHDVRFTGVQLSYLPRLDTFTPVVSLGFNLGRGSLGRSFSADSQLYVAYDFLSAAVGAEFQMQAGFFARLVYQRGFLLYSQARFTHGIYDSGTRGTMREAMHDDILRGVAFSIGWTF